MTSIDRRARRSIAAAALLLVALLGGVLPGPAAAVTLGRISGTVTGPGGVPVPGAEVDAWQRDGNDYGYVETTSDGSYTIFGLNPGTYVVEFYPPDGSGLVPELYDDAPYSSPTEVVVVAGLTTSGIDAELSEGGSISGTVTTPEGISPWDLVVTATNGTASGIAWEVGVDGSYSIDALPAGDYIVTFDFWAPLGLVPELYDDVRMPLAATPVTVVATEDTGGIDATLGPCTSPADFFDVMASNPFCADIDWLITEEITTGYSDGGYHPTSAVTRAAMAAFLYRLAGSPAQTPLAPGTCVFSDVCAGHPFESAIVWIDGEGIAGGYKDGTYRPGAKVSRQAMASFLYKMAGEPSWFWSPFPPEFCDFIYTDVCGNQFLEEIMWLSFTGIAGGYGDGGFHPASPVSRQAMASFLTGFQMNQEMDELFGLTVSSLGAGFGSESERWSKELARSHAG